MQSIIITLLALFALINFVQSFTASRASYKMITLPSSTQSKYNTISKRSSTFVLKAGEGLDAETLSIIGNVGDLSDSVDGVLDATTPVASIVTKIVSSPLILAVPIGAGALIAFLIGFFIYSYGRGSGD